MKRYCLPIKTLFEILDIDSTIDTPNKELHLKSNISVNISTPSGFVPINSFVKKYHTCYTYMLENYESVSCSENHLVFNNGVQTLISQTNCVDTINGPVPIVEKHSLGYQEVYDISIDAPHVYVTPNGVLHHNTTLAKVLVNEIEIDDCDLLFLNASRTNSVDDVRNKITNFISMMPFGDYKVVILDEGDLLSHASQSVLRGILEEYHNTSRFIITGNYPNRIIPAIHSRCQGFHIEKIDQTEFTARVATILLEENVHFEIDVLDLYVKATYPDLRKCINSIQQNVSDQVLKKPNEKNNSGDWRFDMVELFKNGKITEARKLLCSKLRAEEFEEVYRFCYENLELFGNTSAKQDNAVLILKQGLVDHAIVADPEINFSAVMIRLARNAES